jgi:hypothetical protein
MEKWKAYPLGVKIALVSFVALLGVGGVAARYIYTVTLQQQFTLEATLADTIQILEHEAIRNTDGSYRLGTTEVLKNTYSLMPGVDLVKDPFLSVTNKTEVPAYAYVEVVGSLPAGVTYSLTNNWVSLGRIGKQGGILYVYSEDGTNGKVFDGSTADLKLSILQDDVIRVSDSTVPTRTTTLKFYGYLAQVVGNEDATQAFARLQ